MGLKQIIVCETGKAPEVRQSSLGLKTMQELVGGMIQIIALEEGVDMILNEEGRLHGLPFNRTVTDSCGQEWDVLGNLFIVGADEEGESIGLTDEQVEKWLPNLAPRKVELTEVSEGHIEVWHARNNNFFPLEMGLPQPPWPDDFEKVATVATDSLDIAYQKTNHIFRAWQENEEVIDSVEKARSTSCGDVLLLPDGKAMRVAGTGFCEVGKEAEHAASQAKEIEEAKAAAERSKIENERLAEERKIQKAKDANRDTLASAFEGNEWQALLDEVEDS